MYEINKICVDPTASLKKVIKVLDETAVQIVMVVDEDRHLLGTITDGDIRRALLRGMKLNATAHEIMNSSPRIVPAGTSEREINLIMRQNFIKQLPVIDEHGRVVEIRLLKDLLKSVQRETPVVIMAGGFGKRLMPLTQSTPKPLLKVGDKPILRTIIENLKEQGFCNIILSINYLGDEIERCLGNGRGIGVNIEYLRENRPLGTVGALSQLNERIDSSFVVMNGDILTNVNFSDLLHYHAEEGGIATMCVREYDIQVPFGVAELDGHYLLRMTEKPVHSFFVNAGIYVLDPAVLEYIPEKTYHDMTDLLQSLLERRKRVACFYLREYWIDIGRLDHLEQANREYNQHFGK